MKSTELRIGNYVNTPNGIKRVSTISVDGWSMHKESEPIPLTEEWLLKAGASPRIQNTEFIYDRFRLIWKKSYKYWYVIGSDSLSYFTKIEYVHEWQNFVYVMNGQELILK